MISPTSRSGTRRFSRASRRGRRFRSSPSSPNGFRRAAGSAAWSWRSAEWFNIGSRKEYLSVHKLIRDTGWKPAYLTENWPLEVSPDAKVAKSARLQGFCSLGKGCVVGENAVLENSILWTEARIADGAHLGSCIVTERLLVSGEHSNVDFT